MATTTVIKRNANVANLNSGITEETLFFAGSDENEDFVMDISQENTSAILNELTDLSSNPGAYAIREAYSNAYDAVAATGDMSRPIEVTVPGTDEFREESLAYKLHISECPLDLIRYATVTDHGIGMTTEDLRKFFTQYGGTKKQGQGLIGSKGLGSKAPLACADFFDVVTVKDGIRSVAHLWRGNGRNYAKIVKVESTTKPNGTTIRIPIVDPKIAAEMHECMTGIAQWNLDANLTYNGEKVTTCLNDGINKDGTRGYVFLGNVKIGVDEDGNDVRVRMWQSIDSFPQRLKSYQGYDSLRWNLNVDLNLCGVRYSLVGGSSYRSSIKMPPDIIVAGDPGYLNFTPSRDEVKDDDAKQAFLDALSETEYDADAVINSIFKGHDYATITRILMNRGGGHIRTDGDEAKLVIANHYVVGKVSVSDVSAITSFDGTDMRDYLTIPAGHAVAPASTTRYRSITHMSGHGYIAPVRSLDANGMFNTNESAYSTISTYGSYTAREVASAMSHTSSLPLVAIIPSAMMFAYGGADDNNRACRSILNDEDNHALVITGPTPKWTEFQNRESSIRRIIANKTGQDMKKMSLTYLFLDGDDAPTKQDELALTLFANTTITTWEELVSEVRRANRSNRASYGQDGTRSVAKPSTHVGTHDIATYDLRNRCYKRGNTSPFAGPLDALFGEVTYAMKSTIDFDNDDLSRYVFAIGDGGDSATVVRIASAMALAGLLGEAQTLCFVSSTASCTTSYPLGVNEVKALAKRRGMKVLGDFRYSGAHFDGIIDGIDGITYEVKNDGNGWYHVESSIALDVLGITDPSDGDLAYALRHDGTFRHIGNFVLNCRSILGTTFCKTLDSVLDARPANWWNCDATGIKLSFPKGWADDMATLTNALEVFLEISTINGVQSLIAEASDENGQLAKALITSGLQSIVQSRIA